MHGTCWLLDDKFVLSLWKHIWSYRDIFLLTQVFFYTVYFIYILSLWKYYIVLCLHQNKERGNIFVLEVSSLHLSTNLIFVYTKSFVETYLSICLGWPRQFLLKCLYQAWGSEWSCICVLIVSIFLFIRFFYWILGCSDSGIFPP